MDPGRTYRHFCAMARSLEVLGERWSLLVVRDLLLGPRRFSDLQRSLGGITPTRLTERLRHLQNAGIVERDRRQGRREVWYRLTEAGQDLGVVVDALTLWGIQHVSPAMRPGEPVRPEHVMNGTKVWLAWRQVQPRSPVTWMWRFTADEPYTLRFDGTAWRLTREDATHADVNVVVRTTPEAWAGFLTTPPPDRRLPDRGIHLTSTPAALAEFAAAFHASPRAG
jgi:DNA-binding HxlR family transcriptional regulator